MRSKLRQNCRLDLPRGLCGNAKGYMFAKPRFKHVKGPAKTFESICMNCLLTVGICSSEEELAEKESRHACGERVDQQGLPVHRRDSASPTTTIVSAKTLLT
jgi:hypothetical protein